MTWSIILAGGSGTRLAAQAQRQYGYPRPKQFCDFDGHGTLLSQTIHRAARLSAPSRTLVTTVRAHREEALSVLRTHPQVVHLEEPVSRDTTPGILMPLVHVVTRDPAASVVILPADHHVTHAGVFADAVYAALMAVNQEPERVAVLAAEPAGPTEDYGWLLPAADGRSVERFREKPAPAECASLQALGALVNTLVFAARATTLAEIFARHAPAWWRMMTEAAGDRLAIEAAYEALPPSSFSRDILQAIPERLLIVPLARAAGWTDVGTPNRFSAVFGAPPPSARVHTQG